MRITAFLFLAILHCVQPAWCDSAAEEELRREIRDLREAQRRIQKDLDEIKLLLRGAQAPNQPAQPVLKLDSAPFLGDLEAKLAVVEFSDYECTFCRRHFKEVFPRLVVDYVNTGKLRYILRDFPLESMHGSAVTLASAAHCAGEQNRYWQMHDRIFTALKSPSQQNLATEAEAAGLNAAAFTRCVESGKYEAVVRSSVQGGLAAGVSGTPTFLIGFVTEDSSLQPVKKLVGAQPYAVFQEAIESVLRGDVGRPISAR